MEVFRSLLRFILKVKELYLHATQTFHVEICMFTLVLDALFKVLISDSLGNWKKWLELELHGHL